MIRESQWGVIADHSNPNEYKTPHTGVLYLWVAQFCGILIPGFELPIVLAIIKAFAHLIKEARHVGRQGHIALFL